MQALAGPLVLALLLGFALAGARGLDPPGRPTPTARIGPLIAPAGLLVAALFALAHGPLYWAQEGAVSLLRMGSPLCVGLSTGWLWERSGNLTLVGLYHSLLDAAVL